MSNLNDSNDEQRDNVREGEENKQGSNPSLVLVRDVYPDTLPIIPLVTQPILK